jgi:ligand-binding sensor protein
MYQNGISLKSLVHLEKWQAIQDSLSEVLGINLRSIDINSELLTQKSGTIRICKIIPPDNPIYSKLCGNCPLQAEIKKELKLREEANFKCPFGLDIFVLPIKAFGNSVLAYIIIGPLILNARKPGEEYAACAKEFGIEAEKLLDAIIEINVLSYNKLRSIMTLLDDIFSYMIQTGYHKKRLGEIGQDIIEVDPLFSNYYEEKVLNTLLNISTAALEADSGSVMTVDKETAHLHIKVAKKLDNDIVSNTNVKMGEGIAGVVAATAEPIVLPNDKDKNGLSKKMKREYIRSSMIVPLSKANSPSVYGVINLNITRKDKEFSHKDISLIKGLIKLASIALLPVE